MLNKFIVNVCAAAAALCAASSANAAFHLWRVSEMFTDSTGNVQFIEMFTAFSGQQFMTTHSIACSNLSNTQTNTYNFQSNTCSPTTNKRIVLATAAFAALPGSVVPDYIIPANFLFKEGGSINFGPGQQSFIYQAMPTNGTLALQDDTITTAPPYVFTTGTNNPTNCAGNIGSVNVPPPVCIGDLNNDGQRNTADLTSFLGQFGQSGPGLSADLNNDGSVNTADLTQFLGVFGVPCP